ncbi:MAG TPA: tetratricopeptide repeat protein, partial [Nitrospira sp.]|nr:tetratricopeptide repeat protein [Nitrospira sp.]
MNRSHMPSQSCAGFVAPLMLAVALVGACATSDEMKQKSKGYYQEGMASLEHDRQKAYVSFQKAVQLDPQNKEARYGLGHILVYQGKLSQAEREFREAIKIDENYS